MSTGLRVEDVSVSFGRGRHAKTVLHGVSLDLAAGTTMGLVGESGSGKTTLGRAVLGLVPVQAGRILIDDQDVTHLSSRARRPLAKTVQVVFQDPYSSLNPAMTVRDILTEPLRVQGISGPTANARVRDLLDKVALPASALDRFSHEFSGGQRQRVAIARALALDPRLVVCDEPVSALDLSTQLKVLELLIEIQERTGVSYLFISHDLAVVRAVSHRIAVMQHGEIVEQGTAEEITENPMHSYTKELWAANLVADPSAQAERREARRALREQRVA